MKIALLCTSLGHTYRGIERFTLELFSTVKDDVPLTLFGSGLNGAPNARSLPCLKHDSRWLAPFKGKARNNYYFQQLSYAFSFIPLAVWQGYDIVHYSEPGIGNFLFHARKVFGFRYKLIFTDALGLDPFLDQLIFERQDCSQAVTLPHYHKLMRAGVDPNKIVFVPYGIDSKRYLSKVDKERLRAQHGIPKGKYVILCVAALNRRHKRIDYLIREVSRAGKDYFLLVAGQPEEPDLAVLGREILGENFRSLYIRFDQIAELYQLADLFVMPSLVEGFCLALVEAMCAGLPVIAHKSSHFEWVIGDPQCLTDLSGEGRLAEKIKEVVTHDGAFQNIAEKNRTRAIERFDWNRLKKEYLSLYERVSLSS